MMKYRGCLLLLLALCTAPVLALVDPFLTTQTVPGWMAEIQVWTDADDQYHEFCQGALIASQWVLSSGTCMTDQNHYLDGLSPGEDPKFLVKLGANGESVEVEKFYFSDDYTIALFRIVKPAQATPLALSTMTATQLLGSQLTILGKEKTSAVFHTFFNPGVTATPVICKINGVEFLLDGAYCFVQTKLTTSSTLYKATATVIDPAAANAPATSLDKAVTIDRSGNLLYLDFRASRTYACAEDVGLPLLVKAANGSDEIAGVVSAAGATAGLQVCGMSLANVFASAVAIRRFVDKTYAEYDFAALCPATPVAEVSYTSGAGISLQWNSVKGAAGYKVHYTTRHGQVPIATVNVQTQTTINTVLAHGVDYLVAVTAYNANCSSALSKPLAVNVDVH